MIGRFQSLRLFPLTRTIMHRMPSHKQSTHNVYRKNLPESKTQGQKLYGISDSSFHLSLQIFISLQKDNGG